MEIRGAAGVVWIFREHLWEWFFNWVVSRSTDLSGARRAELSLSQAEALAARLRSQAVRISLLVRRSSVDEPIVSRAVWMPISEMRVRTNMRTAPLRFLFFILLLQTAGRRR